MFSAARLKIGSSNLGRINTDTADSIIDCQDPEVVIRLIRKTILVVRFWLFAIMSDETKESLSANDLLKNSSLYREFQAEREEILKHKWIESEKAGRDIGFERALTDWIIKHRSKWRKSRQMASH